MVELFSMIVGLIFTGGGFSVLGATFLGLSEEGMRVEAFFGDAAGFGEGAFLGGTGDDRLEAESVLLKIFVFIRITARSLSCRSFSSTCRSSSMIICCSIEGRSLKMGTLLLEFTSCWYENAYLKGILGFL